MSPAWPTVSVIVPVHNGGPSFGLCLASLCSASPSPLEIIAVVNGDPDGSSLVAETFGVRVIRLPDAVGPALARNVGARHANGEILFFVDADVTVPATAIATVASTFARDWTLTAMFGSYDDAPAAPNFLSQYKNLMHHYVHQTANESACTFWGACGAIRSDAFTAMGGFDTQYRRPSIEDIEFGYRLRGAGLRVSLNKALQVKHLKRWGWRSLLTAEFTCRALPWSELILRHGGFANDLNIRVDQRVSVALAYAALLSAALQMYGVSMALLMGLLVINAPFYAYLRKKRGLIFALRSIPLHWLYFVYSGLAFGIAASRHVFKRTTKVLST